MKNLTKCTKMCSLHIFLVIMINHWPKVNFTKRLLRVPYLLTKTGCLIQMLLGTCSETTLNKKRVSIKFIMPVDQIVMKFDINVINQSFLIYVIIINVAFD